MATEESIPEPKPVVRSRSTQDKGLSKEIATAGQIIRAVMADTEVAAELTEGGYAPTELQRGLTLQQAAEGKLADRLLANGAQGAATKSYSATVKSLTTTYSRLRGLARSAFPKDPDALKALAINGREPRDLPGLLAACDELIKNAPDPAYTDKLTRRGVTTAKLTDLKSKLAAVQEANRLQEIAKSATPRATAQRDAAVQALTDWMREFKLFARAQFKDRPEILKRWGI